jgi:hypothetical protein
LALHFTGGQSAKENRQIKNLRFPKMSTLYSQFSIHQIIFYDKISISGMPDFIDGTRLTWL